MAARARGVRRATTLWWFATRDNSVDSIVVVGTVYSVRQFEEGVTIVTNPVTLLFFYTAMSTFLRQAANVVRAPSPTSSAQNILITGPTGPPGIIKARFRVLDRVTQGYVLHR